MNLVLMKRERERGGGERESGRERERMTTEARYMGRHCSLLIAIVISTWCFYYD